MPKITGGELDADTDEDDDPNVLLAKQPMYVADQSALIAAIAAEATAAGKPAVFVAEVTDFLTMALPKVVTALGLIAPIL